MWFAGTGAPVDRMAAVGAIGLFTLAAFATSVVSSANPFYGWGSSFGVILIASAFAVRALMETSRSLAFGPTSQLVPRGATMICLLAIGGWGFGQLALNLTVYRYATLNAATYTAALAATGFLGAAVLRDRRIRTGFLRAFAVFGFLVSLTAVLAHFTAGDKVLWLVASPYPDTWGVFLSRNDFAVFLELVLPVTLWFAKSLQDSAGRSGEAPRGAARVPTTDVLMSRAPSARFSGREVAGWGSVFLCMAAFEFAAGAASASRAGALILLSEVALLCFRWPPRLLLKLAAISVVSISVTGVGPLVRRLSSPDPFEYRREILASTIEMIRERPWTGSGLGTFAQVYPAHARFDSGAIVNHAHDDWLEWTSEGGLPFALLWGVLALWSIRRSVRAPWGLGVPAVFLHALVDYPFARFGLAAWTFAMIGALDAHGIQERSGLQRPLLNIGDHA